MALEIRFSLSKQMEICRMVYWCLEKLRSNGHGVHDQMIHNNAWVSG